MQKIKKTIRYEFQNEIFKDEINKILYYNILEPNKKMVLNEDDYELEEGKKLKIIFPGQSNAVTYAFEIYPEYNNNITNAGFRFYLYFLDYLLKNEAIYIQKNSANLNPISFKTLLKKNFDESTFTITESNENINCEKFECKNYLCDCSLNFRYKTSPIIIKITYKTNQFKYLYLIYISSMEKCYDKVDDQKSKYQWNGLKIRNMT